jgi:hypothetical protein
MAPRQRALAAGCGAHIRQLLAAHPFDRNAWDCASAQDLHVRIGNARPAVGKDAALEELSRFFARIRSVGAGFCEMCHSGNTVFAEMEVEFSDAGGVHRRIPCVVVVRVEGRALLDVRLHLDPSPIPEPRALAG